MNYQLICVDIDGTLLDDKKNLPPRVKDSLQKAAGQGIRIALISGRMPAGVERIEKELDIPCIKVCNAGTYILLEDRRIAAEYLPPCIMKNTYKEIVQKRRRPLWIFRKEHWYVTDIDPYIEREIEIIGCRPEIVDAEMLAEQWNREGTGPNKLLIAAEPNALCEIYHDMRRKNWSGIEMARSADTFLEIFPKGVTKGTALAAICRELRIELKNTIAFGDHELDIPMIEAAGVGIAMGNAIEELKKKADFITSSNNEAGVARALEHYLA